jgi:hypothetical protein
MTVGAILTYESKNRPVGSHYLEFKRASEAPLAVPFPIYVIALAEREAVCVRINIAPNSLVEPLEVDLHGHLSELSGRAANFCQTPVKNHSRHQDHLRSNPPLFHSSR